MAEKTARHAADAAAASAARASESSAQKRTRRQRDAISTSAARAVEGPTERLERLQTVNQLRHAQRGLCSPPKQFWFKLAFNYDPVLRLSGRKDLQIGSMSVVCGHCNAKKWPGESAGLCCSDGKIQLAPFQELPAPLKALLEGSSLDSKHFLAKIRQYNCAFQMTSFGGNAFREVGWNPTFKVQGQVYHRIGSLLPETATDSAFLQIYFITDYNQQADAHMGIIPENDTGQHNHPRRDIIMSLQQMLHEINNYVRSFKFPIHERFPAIVQLAVHLENDELRYFSADTAMDVAARTKDTTLRAFFKLGRQDEFARTLLYPDVPPYYVWTAGLGGSAGPTSRARQASKKTPHSEGYSRFPHRDRNVFTCDSFCTKLVVQRATITYGRLMEFYGTLFVRPAPPLHHNLTNVRTQ
ncbi:unnamed protein product [Acanthosepion pharaonis]|uniref:Helitron helicase-like domain-containing protein n=1 Tax=Acanthosepion pharaonis TaxID=158019 RepID=A0A812DR50_ACAPH|nr:unnamed protein product [Sepia pharaonis]